MTAEYVWIECQDYCRISVGQKVNCCIIGKKNTFSVEAKYFGYVL